MNEDYLYSVIGKLYVDNLNFQRFIPQLQTSLQSKDQEIGTLRLQLEEQATEWNTVNENAS
jgi:flagellar biosynthesis chaperone FliJ